MGVLLKYNWGAPSSYIFWASDQLAKTSQRILQKKVDVNSTKDLTLIWTGTWMVAGTRVFAWWWLVDEGTSLGHKQQNRGYQHQAWGYRSNLGMQSAKSSKHSSTMFGYIILYSHK